MDAVSILEQIAGEANPSKREAMLAGVMSDMVEALASVHQTVSWGDRMLTLDKAAAFLDEPRFASALAAISGRTGMTSMTASRVSPGGSTRSSGQRGERSRSAATSSSAGCSTAT